LVGQFLNYSSKHSPSFQSQLFFAPKPLIPNALLSTPLFLHPSMLLYALVFSTIHPKEQKENFTQALHASLGLVTSVATWYETSFMLDWWWKNKLFPNWDPNFCFLVPYLCLCLMNKANMGFQCHVCLTLQITSMSSQFMPLSLG